MADLPTRLSYLVDTDQIVHENIPRDVECKFFDTDFNATITSVNSLISTVNLIPQGFSASTRIAEHVVVKSIQVQGRCTNTQTGSLSGIIYMWLVLDKQANGAQPIATDVWNTDNLSLTLRNLNNMSRFVLLQGWLFQMAQDGDDFFDTAVNINYVTGVDIPIHFDGTAGLIGEITGSNLSLWAGTDNGSFTGGNLRGKVRIRYTD